MCIASTDRRCTRGCHVSYPLRLTFLCLFFFCVFFFFFVAFFIIDHFFRFKIFGYRIFVTDFRDARSLFSAERRQTPKQNSTLSVCEICTSKQLFLLATKIVSKYHRICHVNPVQSLILWDAQTHPRGRYTELLAFLI